MYLHHIQTRLEHPLNESHFGIYLSKYFRNPSNLPEFKMQICFSFVSIPLSLGQPIGMTCLIIHIKLEGFILI